LALFAIGAAVDPVDRLGPEEVWSLPLQPLVDAERRDVGISAGIEKRDARGDLERLRGVGLGSLGMQSRGTEHDRGEQWCD